MAECWLSFCDSLAALVGVDVTDLVVDCKSMTEWLTELVTVWLPCLLCMLYSVYDFVVDWLNARLSFWLSDSLAVLFAVDVTDLVVDWLNVWLNGWLS